MNSRPERLHRPPPETVQGSQLGAVAAANDKLHLCHETHSQPILPLDLPQEGDSVGHPARRVDHDGGVDHDQASQAGPAAPFGFRCHTWRQVYNRATARGVVPAAECG